MTNLRIRCRTLLMLSSIVAARCVAEDGFGAAEKSRISVSVKVQKERSADDGKTEVETDKNLTATAVKVKTEVCTLQITIKNDGDQQYEGQVEWCFVSDHSSGKLIQQSPEKAVSSIFSPGKKKIMLAAHSVTTETVISDPFVYEEKTVERENSNSNRRNSATISRDYETGDVYKGYIVLFTVNGEVFAAESNSAQYLRDEWIRQCRNPPPPPAKEKKKKQTGSK